PSFKSVVMSLKRMPSVGKSLMSRIFARRSSTFMAGILPRLIGFERRDGRGEITKTRDRAVGARRAGILAAAHHLHRAEPRLLRALHVEADVVADVHRARGLAAHAAERREEDLGRRLPDPELVGERQVREGVEQSAAREELAKD